MKYSYIVYESSLKTVFCVLFFVSVSFFSGGLVVHGQYGITNPGTATSPAGALSNSGCFSCSTGLTGTNTGFGVPSPISATLGSSYSSSPVHNSSGGGGIIQSSSKGGSQSLSGGMSGGGGGVPQSLSNGMSGGGGQSPACPIGYTYASFNSSWVCCPASKVIYTHVGSGKGATTYASCSVTPSPSTPSTPSTPPPPASCILDGISIAGDNKDSYPFYNVTSVPYGQTCSPELRTCNNGVLGGDPAYIYVTKCAEEKPILNPISIQTEPSIIRYGGSTTVTWNGANADSCTVTGPLIIAQTSVKGSVAVSNIESQSTYTLECVLGPVNNRTTGSASATVKVLSSEQET